MTNQALKEYMLQARGQGMSNEQIIQALTMSGWRIHDLVEIVLDAPLTNGSLNKLGAEENIISVREISKSYGKLKALDNISLDVKKGRVTALLGPNGAGKTTLVRILATLLAPTHGIATVAGFNVVTQAQALRSVIGLAGQYAAVDEVLTGRENLEMVAKLYHLKTKKARERTKELLKQFDLEDAGDRPVKTYSGGMRRRLDLAASLVIRPQVLFLDEPTTGLDPQSRFTMWNVIRDLVEGGTTILLTTQYMEEADQLAQQIFVIDHGHLIAQGTPDELKRQSGGDILEIHLSQHAEAERAARLIQTLGVEPARGDVNTGVVLMSVRGGASVLVDVIRQLDIARIKVHDIMLRRPSLDDVFLKLTGHGAES